MIYIRCCSVKYIGTQITYEPENKHRVCGRIQYNVEIFEISETDIEKFIIKLDKTQNNYIQ